MYIILVYDIFTDEKGKKILPKVFKICKKYLTHIQNSVFEGEVSQVQLRQLKIELSKHIRSPEDSLIIFKTRQEKWLDKEYLGGAKDETDNFL
ncbi:MAG: CRISPR-associated endonuclease Cas2 [Ruminococcus sp.]|nr:CRISPR-associated endonuclease Cas2 [Ruminococcus sp.]